MAQLKFYRKSEAPSSPAAGAIWFNTSDKTIQIYTGSEWEKYAGNLKDATWSTDKKTLTITKHDGSSIALDFSDMASATVMGKMIRAVGINTDGTFKKNATNYGGSATSIGAEVAAIDAATKAVSDLVGTTSVATQITNASNAIIGTSSDDLTDLTLEGVKKYAAAEAASALSTSTGNLSTALSNLTVEDTVVDNQYVSAVQSSNGKIRVSRASLPVVGVAANDKLLSLSGDKIASTIGFSYDSNAKKIKLTGVNNEEIGSVDTTDFIKDGMLSKAEFNESNHVLTLTFNTDAGEDPITVDLSKLVDTYKAGNGLSLATDGTFSVDTSVIATKSSVDNLNGGNLNITGYAKGEAADLAATDTINAALGKLEARVAAAAAGGVQTVNSMLGNIKIDEGSTNGTIAIGNGIGTNKDIKVHGLKSAAYTDATDYATASNFEQLSTLVGTSSNGVNTGIFKIIEENEKTTANSLTDLDTRLKAVNALLEWAEF